MTIRQRIEREFARFGRMLLRFRWAAILLFVAASLGLGSQLPKLRVDNSDESFLRRDDPARISYDRFKEQFGKDTRIYVIFRPPEIFDLGFLDQLRSIHRDIERETPYVEEVTSLINARNTRGEADRLIVEELTVRWPRNAADLESLRARVFSNPLYLNVLITENESLTAISIKPFTYSTLTAELDELAGFEEGEGANATLPVDLTSAESSELLASVRAIVARHAQPGDEIIVAGNDVIDEKMNQVMSEDIGRSFGFCMLLIVLILSVLFRSLAGALIPVLVVVASLVATFGTMAIVDIPFSMTLNILPALLLTVGVCDSIHILSIVYQRLAAGDSRADAIVHALEHSGLAVVMTSLTTAAGLGSFVTAKLAAVSHLGWIAPLGVAYAMLYSLVLLPALLSVLPLGRAESGRSRIEKLAVDGLLAGLSRVATRSPRAVLGGAALILLISFVGVAQVRFSHDGIRWLPEDDPDRVSAELIDREFKGTSSLEVVIDTGRANGLHEPDVLARIERAMRWSETLSVGDYPVHTAVSIVDIVKEVNRALNADRPDAHVVPAQRSLIAQELLLFENSGSDDLEDWTDSLFQTARMIIRTPWVDAMVYPAFVEEVRTGLPEILGTHLSFELTGTARIFSGLFQAVILSMAHSYLIALLVITPLLILLVGNLKRGLLAMIPNLIPVVLTLALMGWMGIPLDASTLLIGGVVLGVAVDDTIHFMHKFNRYYEDSGDPIFAVERTLATTGAAMLFTSFVLTAGFAVFTTTYLVNTAWLGLLAAFASVIAFLADVLVAPALMVLASPKRD